jgi:hypothetical protein
MGKKSPPHLKRFGTGYKSTTGRWKTKTRKKKSEREFNRYRISTEVLFLIFRGRELKLHFHQSTDNLKLPREDRLKYISNPEYIWWKVTKKEVTTRFLRDLTEPYDFFSLLFNDTIRPYL